MDAAEAASTHPTTPPCRLLLAKPVTSSLVSALVPPPLPHRSGVVRCHLARLVRVMDAASLHLPIPAKPPPCHCSAASACCGRGNPSRDVEVAKKLSAEDRSERFSSAMSSHRRGNRCAQSEDRRQTGRRCRRCLLYLVPVSSSTKTYPVADNLDVIVAGPVNDGTNARLRPSPRLLTTAPDGG